MESGTGKQERRNAAAADTHKMSPEEVKRAGVEESKRQPGHNPGTVLHQRRRLPFSLTTIAITGVAISGAVWYFTLYAKKKPEASAADVAKVAAGGGGPESTHPRK
nr:Transmembrane protein [Ipomoea batatas]